VFGFNLFATTPFAMNKGPIQLVKAWNDMCPADSEWVEQGVAATDFVAEAAAQTTWEKQSKDYLPSRRCRR